MNLLFLIDSLGSGGAQRQMVTLAEMLQVRNYNISFLIYHPDDFFKEYIENLNIPILVIPEDRPLLRILKIRNFIRRGGYDGVISFLETPNFLNCFSAIGGKKWKVITSERSSKDSTFVTRKGKIFAWFQRYSDAIVCNSFNSKTLWEKYYPQYNEKISVIYNPVILPKITSSYIPKRNGKLHIVVAASYRYLKNPIGLIKALNLMRQEDRNMIEVNWYGDFCFKNEKTNAYNEAINLIETYKLINVIHLNEPTKDIADKMNEADVIALFSKLEGLPNAICEGMMIGKPIIMSRVSDFKVLIDDKNGFLCDWDNPENIKDVIVKTINLSVEQLIELGIQSKNKANVLFSSSNIENQWDNIIKS